MNRVRFLGEKVCSLCNLRELNSLFCIHFPYFRLAVSEALSTIQRAEEILSVHCGPQSTQIQELQEMKTCLLELPRSILQRT